MRKCIILVLSLLFTAHLHAPNSRKGIEIWEPTPVKNMELENRKLRILKAIWWIEHPRTEEQAIQARYRENAVGRLQIRPIMVATVNQIVGYNKYYLQDRTDSVKSVEMFMIYQNYYNPRLDEKKAALLWNMGSNYMKAKKEHWENGLRYWNKISKILNKG